MANVVVLHQYGCSFGVAERIYVVREQDITKEFLHEILSLMDEVDTSSPQEFFRKTKVCILTDQSIYKKILSALAEEVKNL
jgi:Glu-tRNA(Gln) amidotransferase subunit E-like FAD-binding protein